LRLTPRFTPGKASRSKDDPSDVFEKIDSVTEINACCGLEQFASTTFMNVTAPHVVTLFDEGINCFD